MQRIVLDKPITLIYGGTHNYHTTILTLKKGFKRQISRNTLKLGFKVIDPIGMDLHISNLNDFDLGGVSKTIRALMHEVSTYEGVEVFENRNLRAVELDVDCFAKETKSVERHSV